MLLALSGITGVGKSYFKDIISNELNFYKINTIRTRKSRKNEINGVSGIFMTNEELDSEIKLGNIIYDFNVFGGRYAYLKNEILSNENHVFEMHYTMLEDWKKIVPDIKTIYIFPTDINIAKQNLKNRQLEPQKEVERLLEIDEQYNKVLNDSAFQSKFDYIFYNDYTNNSVDELLTLITKMLGEN